MALIALCLAIAGCGGSSTRGGTDWPDQPGDVDVDYDAGLSAMQRLNFYRIEAGLLPVALSYSLSSGCQLHANYLALNDIDLRVVGLDAHGEKQSLPGYSVAGDTAGRASVIYQGVAADEAIEGWMQTFYHRLGLFDPNLSSIGFGSRDGYQVMDMTRGRVYGSQAMPAMIRTPAAGVTNAPFAYRTEIPHPIPGDESLGVPITVEFFGSRGQQISNVRAGLRESLTSAPVPFYLQAPGRPFLPDWDLRQLICLIPQEPLRSGQSYTVFVEGIVDGEEWQSEWSFSTR